MYSFDGFELDFARHTPCLPPGRQWELREHATAFVRGVREMLLVVAEERGTPILLAAKVPGRDTHDHLQTDAGLRVHTGGAVLAEDLAGCRTDGFDVATWAREGLVDILILGNRTTTVDVAAFRQLLAANPGPVAVTLCPMFDRHHTTDGYYDPPHGFHSAVFANFWAQGADSVASTTACNELPRLAWLRSHSGGAVLQGMFNWPPAPTQAHL